MVGLIEGRIVHYVDGKTGLHLAAIVTAVFNTYVNLAVFPRWVSEGLQQKTSVFYSDDHSPNTWHWIEGLDAPIRITTPDVPVAWPAEDEILPEGAPAEGRLDLTRADRWKHKSTRNVRRAVGGGRYVLVWAKGAAIPDEEAKRQGLL